MRFMNVESHLGVHAKEKKTVFLKFSYMANKDVGTFFFKTML